MRPLSRSRSPAFSLGESEYMPTNVTMNEQLRAGTGTSRRRAGGAGGGELAGGEQCAPAPHEELEGLGRPGLARLERAVLKLVDGNQHLRLQLLLTRLAEKAARRRLRRVAPLFNPDRTLVDQCARYLCSYASR